jgi:hypothetical protein
MITERENFDVFFEEINCCYITDLIEALEENLGRIMRFFELSRLTKKIAVRLWNSTEAYAHYLKPYIGEYHSWLVADTYNGDINILAYALFIQSDGREKSTMDDYRKVIVHELVHACQKEVNPQAKDVFWYWEALATNLAGQQYPLLDIPYTMPELSRGFMNLHNSYTAAYTLGRYLLEHYSNERLLEYARKPSGLIADSERILKETKSWVHTNTMNP